MFRTTRRWLAAAAVPFALILTACGDSSSGTKAAVKTTTDASCTPAHTFKTVTPGQLTVAAYMSPPYTVDEPGGGLGGVDGVIVTDIAKRECLDLVVKPVTGAAGIPTIQSARADMAVGGWYRTAERAKIVNLTDTAWRDGMALLSKDGVDSIPALEGKQIGVVQGQLWNEDLQSALGQDHVKLYQDAEGVIADLRNGRIVAGVFTSAEAATRARQYPELTSAELKPDPRVSDSTKPGEVVYPNPRSLTGLNDALNADIQALVADGVVARALTSAHMSPTLAGSGS